MKGRALAMFLPLVLAGAEPSLYLNYSPHPPPDALLRHTVCILDPAAKADLKPGQAKGNRFYAYVSVVELSAHSALLPAATARGVTFVGENTAWNSRLMDVTRPAWRGFLLEDAAQAAAKAGFDGFFLDTADSLSLLPTSVNPSTARAAVLEGIRALKSRWPEKKIILNRGFDLLPDLKGVLDGLLVESVYQTFDPATKRHKAVPAAGSRWLEGRIREAQGLSLPVYAVDYVNPIQSTLAAKTAMKLRALGAVPLVTTPDLNGQVLAP